MKLFISYAWADNADGNFDYLVQELANIGIEAIFDRVAFVPGQPLWSQIGDKITNGDIDGWAYLITPNSLISKACREELEYAINRAIHKKTGVFPLIGLLHGVKMDDLPSALKVRLCISLINSNWAEQVKASLENRPPINTVSTQPLSQFQHRLTQHQTPEGLVSVFELFPRFGEIRNIRIVVPQSTNVINRGFSVINGLNSVSGVMHDFFDLEVDLENAHYKGFGMGDAITPSVAAKIVFLGSVPKTIAYNVGNGPFQVSGIWNTIVATN